MKNLIKAIIYVIGGFALFGAYITLCFIFPTFYWVTLAIGFLLIVALLIFALKMLLDEKDDFRSRT